MKALGKKVIIRPDEKEVVTQSGIEVVDAHTRPDAVGVVTYVGQDIKEITPEMRVFYSPLTYDEIEDGGEIYHVVDEDDVFAIIDKCE